MRSATLFALAGTALWTIHMILRLITNITGLAGGYVAMNAFLGSLIDFLAALSLLVFFAVFYNSRS